MLDWAGQPPARALPHAGVGQQTPVARPPPAHVETSLALPHACAHVQRAALASGAAPCPAWRVCTCCSGVCRHRSRSHRFAAAQAGERVAGSVLSVCCHGRFAVAGARGGGRAVVVAVVMLNAAPSGRGRSRADVHHLPVPRGLQNVGQRAPPDDVQTSLRHGCAVPGNVTCFVDFASMG